MADFQKLFESAPDAYLVLEPNPPYLVQAVNDAYLQLTGGRREDFIGRSLFEAFPKNLAASQIATAQALREALDRVLATRQVQILPRQQYDLATGPDPSTARFEQRFWSVYNIPVLAADGRVTAIVHRAEDITSVVRLEALEREEAERNRSLRARAEAASQAIARRDNQLAQTRRQLAQNEERLHDVATRLEVAAKVGEMGTWIWEPQTDRLFADEHVARWFRVPPATARGGSLQAYLDAVHPDDAPGVRAAIVAAVENGQLFEAEYRIRRENGPPWRWVLARARVERDAAGRVARLIGIVLDISELQHARIALHATQEHLRLAAEAAEIGSFSWTVPPGDLVWDAQCKAHFWLPPDAAVSFQLFYSIIHPEDRARTRAAIDDAVQDHASYDVEYRTVSAAGQIRWIHAKGRAHPIVPGDAIRFDGITLDVTHQKRIETELRESEARYRLVVESLRDHAIFLLDDFGRVTHWNVGAERLLGYTESEIIGQSARILFTPEDQARGEPEKEIATAKATGMATDDRWHVRKDGSRFFVTGMMSAVLDSAGRRLGLAKIMRDVTERQAAAAERERLLERERAARAEAERSNRLKEEFLATLSHELRTPLNAILGWTQILKGGELEPQDFASGLEVIERNTRIQVKLIEDLLDMSRIISGKVRLEVQNVPVAGVVNAAIDAVRSAADAKHLRLTAVYQGAGATVLGDPNRLQQVAWNLLANAIKFTPAGGRVQVSVARDDTAVSIQVADSGVGIPSEFLPHVFERFRQADASTTRPHGGLGLGLAIVKQLVELHGGRVTAESPGPGQGATFTVTIPLAARPPIEAPPVRRPLPLPVAVDEPAADLQGVKVLVVDDAVDSGGFMKRVLESHRAEVRTAHSMEEALQVLDGFAPDVLLSDIGMPLHDGYELIRRVRSLPRGATLPAAAITALARSEDRARALRAGFHTHVAKPVEPAELLRVVAQLAGR